MIRLLPGAVALLVTLAAIWPCLQIALKVEILDRPGPRKSQVRPVPYLGGVTMLAGVAVGLVAQKPAVWQIAVLLGLMTLLGLVDDIRFLPVWTKLVGETVLACTAVATGLAWHLTGSPAIDGLLSVLWILGLTNSFNLLDNMDGLACTVGAGALAALLFLSPQTGPIGLPLLGAALAFLAINRPAAKMYMGDAGSLMLGFGIAVTSIKAANTLSGLHSVVMLVFPVAVAVLDTSLVIVSRVMSGRPVQLGGQDHYSHRLRLLGLSRYQILGVTVLASVAAWAGAALAELYPLSDAWLAVPIGLAFVAVWIGLLRVDPYTTAIHPHLEVIREQSTS